MSGYLTGLGSPHARARAKHWVDRAPEDWVCEVREPRRSLPQNDKMHAMLTDVAESKRHECAYDKDDWKLIFLRALMKESPRYLKDLDGEFFPAGYRSSRLSKSQMGELLTLIQAWGDSNGVQWTDGEVKAA